ncbi:MAG: hypothetical protein K9G11_01925 [Rickettsiaceae bacterium]|nr:hypothetical protein [Rickettsiaceae bacterium]
MLYSQKFLPTNNRVVMLATQSSKGRVINFQINLQNGDRHIRSNVKLGPYITTAAITSCNYLILNANKLGIDKNLLLQSDLHINFDMLDDDIIKDGPSCGLAIFLALYTKLKSIQLKKVLAVTGEVTLSGKILGISDLKEKLEAAIQNNISAAIVPQSDLVDIKLMSQDLLKNIEIIAANNIGELLAKLHLMS